MLDWMKGNDAGATGRRCTVISSTSWILINFLPLFRHLQGAGAPRDASSRVRDARLQERFVRHARC
jgi:hypothetical protein